MEPRARLALLAGAGASAAITTYVGWYGARVLIAPFLIWILSPFVMLWWLLVQASRWPPPARRLLSIAATVVSAVSVWAYVMRVVYPPRAQGAFVFVIVPPLAWFAIGAAMLMARMSARGHS
jgi:hypothetical protein